MAPDPTTSVHSIATSDSTPPYVSYANHCRKHCRIEFTATQNLYRAIDADDGTSNEVRLLECRSRAWFVRERETGSVRVVSNHCRLRWCPLCARSRQGYITIQVKEWFQACIEPKLLTLTIRHTDSPLLEQIDRIYSSFRALRRSKFWRKNCRGGVWFFQITYNPKKREWHPHIHCVIDSKYLPYLKLRQLWHYYTSGSDILDIRSVYKIDDAASYVARYASRPHELRTLNIDCQKTLLRSLYGKRMCGTFGTARSIQLSPFRNPDRQNWQNVGSWTVVHELQATSADARAILLAWHTHQPLDPQFSCSELDAFIDGAVEAAISAIGIDPHPPPPSLFE